MSQKRLLNSNITSPEIRGPPLVDEARFHSLAEVLDGIRASFVGDLLPGLLEGGDDIRRQTRTSAPEAFV